MSSDDVVGFENAGVKVAAMLRFALGFCFLFASVSLSLSFDKFNVFKQYRMLFVTGNITTGRNLRYIFVLYKK